MGALCNREELVWRKGMGVKSLGLIGVLVLAGCVATQGAGIRQVALLDGAVVAAAPAGYCIAPGAGQRQADSAVVIMGRCSAAGTAEPAVLTLTVGQAGSAGAMAGGGEALAAYFTSEAGRAALSRSGRAGDVQVISATGVDGAFLVQVRDRVAGEYWRGIAGLRGRLVTVTAAGPSEDAPLPAAKGRALVEAALAALRRANAGEAVVRANQTGANLAGTNQTGTNQTGTGG